MSVINDGNNLPGVIIDIEKEVANDFDTSLFGTTESVVVVGTAFSGSPGVVFPTYGTDHAKYVYGDTYDSEMRRSANLTASIQDAWDRGCRTIYGMRIGGKDIYKDFKLRDDGDLFLRVRAMYPSNKLKDCYFLFDGRAGLESITYYKPASKASITERRAAVVDSTEKMIENTIALNQDNGIDSGESIVELINTFNSHINNNVLRLSIVDEDGNDMTDTNEARALCVGSMFSGVYFIGREMSLCQTYTNIKTEIIINDDDEKPYDSFSGNYYKTLIFNSDVIEPYPIYATTYKELREVLNGVGITSSSSWDFLSTYRLADRAFKRDSVDYEEVNLSKFEIYKRLGSGYAITAQAVDRGFKEAKVQVGVDSSGDPIYETRRVRRKPRVIETPDSDANKVQAIKDGFYSTLQNETMNYRVIACANGDDKIADSIPKADDFKVTVANEIELLGAEDGEDALITATPKLASDDFTMSKKYSFKFTKIDEDEIGSDLKRKIYAAKVAEVVHGEPINGTIQLTIANLLIDKSVKSGTKVAVMDGGNATLVRITSAGYEVLNSTGLQDELICVDDIIYKGVIRTVSGQQVTVFEPEVPTTTSPVTYNDKYYMLIESANEVFVSEIDQNNTSELQIIPLGDLETMLGSNDEATLVYCENNYFSDNRIDIKTAGVEFLSLEEFVNYLNSHTALSKIFNFELTERGYNNKDEYLEDIMDETDSSGAIVEYHVFQTVGGLQQNGIIYTLTEDRTTDYDFSLYIPYKTTDNFYRQLAQHCVAASFSTAMTHGVIGVSTLKDISSKSVAARVEELTAHDFNAYAKKWNGRNMLVSDGTPYPIGSFASLTAMQYNVSDDSGYNYVSNGCAGYAGMVSNLPLTQSSTAQPFDVDSIAFTYTSEQLLNLTNKGIVTARMNDTQTGYIIVDGVTMAPSDELKRRLSIQRTLNETGRLIRIAASPFIGRIGSIAVKQALKTAIESKLNSIKGELIDDYSIRMEDIDSNSIDSEITIKYEIKPINEIRTIYNSITVTRSISST